MPSGENYCLTLSGTESIIPPEFIACQAVTASFFPDLGLLEPASWSPHYSIEREIARTLFFDVLKETLEVSMKTSMKKSAALFVLWGLVGVLFAPALVWAKDPVVIDKRYRAVRLIADTPFPGVNGATIGADGHLYLSHTGNGTITRVDLKTMKAHPFVRPYQGAFILDDLTADDRGNLYATGTTPLVGQVYRIDKNGAPSVIAGGMAAPNGIEYNKKTGRLFVTECFQGNRIYEVDPTGKKEARLLVDANVIAVPEGFDFDPQTNDLIIPDLATGRILRVHPDTGAVSELAKGVAGCIALAIGPDKKIYVPALSGEVYRLNLDGAGLEKIAQLPPGLDNVAVAADGRLFITSYWDATVYEVPADGKGKARRLFETGPNQPLGLVTKGNEIWMADAIMIRKVSDKNFAPTKLNAWALHGMPLPLSLSAGPGETLFWTDCIHNAAAVGNPATGDFQPIAGDLGRPVASLLSADGSALYVAEFAAGQVTAVSLKDGAKQTVATDLQGPLALAMIGEALYVGEAKTGRVIAVDPATGRKQILVSSLVGKPVALAHDGGGNLLVLDGAGQRLVRVNVKTRTLDEVAGNVPVSYSPIGGDPPVEFPSPMAVSAKGDIYLTTAERGLIKFEKKR